MSVRSGGPLQDRTNLPVPATPAAGKARKSKRGKPGRSPARALRKCDGCRASFPESELGELPGCRADAGKVRTSTMDKRKAVCLPHRLDPRAVDGANKLLRLRLCAVCTNGTPSTPPLGRAATAPVPAATSGTPLLARSRTADSALDRQTYTEYFGDASPQVKDFVRGRPVLEAKLAADKTEKEDLRREGDLLRERIALLEQEKKAAAASEAMWQEHARHVKKETVPRYSYAHYLTLVDGSGFETCRQLTNLPTYGLQKQVDMMDATKLGDAYAREASKCHCLRALSWQDAVCLVHTRHMTGHQFARLASMFNVRGKDAGASAIYRRTLLLVCHFVNHTVARQCDEPDLDRHRLPDWKQPEWLSAHGVEDCTCGPVMCPKDFFANDVCYSAYKGYYGWKINVTCGPDGYPIWNTPAHGARADDLQVMEHADAEWASRSWVQGPTMSKLWLGDKGTKAGDLVDAQGGRFVCPPTVHDHTLTYMEVLQAESVAQPRSHVERCIGYLRRNILLRRAIPQEVQTHLDYIIRVALFNIHFTAFNESVVEKDEVDENDLDL